MKRANTFNSQTAKFLGVVGENMPEMSGSLMQGWIECPKALQHALRGALCPLEATAPTNKPNFQTWRTITLGRCQSVQDLSLALKSKGFEFGRPAAALLEKVTFASMETQLPLVNVSVRELGLEDGAILIQIYARAWECGLSLVPAEAGPQLRLQYPDQHDGAWLCLGMQPLPDAQGFQSVFYLERIMGYLWLNTEYAHSSHFSSPDRRWVFAKRSGN